MGVGGHMAELRRVRSGIQSENVSDGHVCVAVVTVSVFSYVIFTFVQIDDAQVLCPTVLKYVIMYCQLGTRMGWSQCTMCWMLNGSWTI